MCPAPPRPLAFHRRHQGLGLSPGPNQITGAVLHLEAPARPILLDEALLPGHGAPEDGGALQQACQLQREQLLTHGTYPPRSSLIRPPLEIDLSH